MGSDLDDDLSVGVTEYLKEWGLSQSTITSFEDVDHRNLISLTHQAPRPVAPRQVPPPINLDQDYRVPPMVPPTDIVETVDMDLSEDEDQRGMFPSQPAPDLRNSFNNNKVLVGGDNGKSHLARRGAVALAPGAPVPPVPVAPVPVAPMLNPFDNMSADLNNFNRPFGTRLDLQPERTEEDDVYEEDLRSRGLENPNLRNLENPNLRNLENPNLRNLENPNLRNLENPNLRNLENPNLRNLENPNLRNLENPNMRNLENPNMRNLENPNMRNPSPPYEEFNEEWNQPRFPAQRFPRNWTPRPEFRPQFWPRNGPRPPNRWMGPRPQRFW